MIRSKLGHYTTAAVPSYFLDTTYPDFNSVIGGPTGIPFGYLIELSGIESAGKTTLALDLLAEAQEQKAEGVWVDVENSLTRKWAARRGVDVDNLCWIWPYLGRFGKKGTKEWKRKRLINAEEMCEEAEAYIKARYVPGKRFFMVVDSVTALLTREEAETGISKANMRSKLSLPTFLGRLLRRWVGFAHSTNTTIIFINQIRINPNQLFGNPEYTPGGKALKFYCHVRVGARRVKDGRLMHSGEQVGIKGYLTNAKNKAGGVERLQIGYKISFKSGETEFMPVSLVKKD
jgi:recombination protein RecA